MSTAAAACPPIFPDPRICSGNGYCDLVAKECVCNSGWTGIGDFSAFKNTNCAINILAIRIQWAVVLLSSLIGLAVFSIYLTRRLRSGSLVLRFRLLREPAHRADFLHLLCALGLIVTSILKIIDPVTFVVGGSIPITISFVFAPICFWGSAPAYVLNMTRMIFKQARLKSAAEKEVVEKAELWISRAEPVFFVYIAIGSLVLFVGLASKSHAVLLQCASAHYAFFGFAFVVGSSMVPYAITLLIRDFNAFISSTKPINNGGAPSSPHSSMNSPGSPVNGGSIKNLNANKKTNHSHDLVRNLVKKLASLRSFLLQNGVPNIVINFLFAFWPFLTSMASYQLPFAWVIFGYFFALSAWMRMNSSKPGGRNAGAQGKATDDDGVTHTDTGPSGGGTTALSPMAGRSANGAATPREQSSYSSQVVPNT